MACEICNLSDSDKKWMLFENTYWTVFLADKQDYPGRLLVGCRQHAHTLSELSDEQRISLKHLVDSCENMLKEKLGATMFNWSYLMNDAYKMSHAEPHIHFHVRPRFAEPVLIAGRKIVDSEFGHHYKNDLPILLTEAEIETIYKQLKQKTAAYFVKE